MSKIPYVLPLVLLHYINFPTNDFHRTYVGIIFPFPWKEFHVKQSNNCKNFNVYIGPSVQTKRCKWRDYHLNTELPSFWLFSHRCSQASCWRRFSRCIDRSWNQICSVSMDEDRTGKLDLYFENRGRYSKMKSRSYLRNWDFAQLGSPTMQTLMSPLRLMPSWVNLWTPPKSISRIALFISWWL